MTSPRPLPPRGLSRPRRAAAWVLAAAGLPALTALLVAARSDLSYATPVLLVLLLVLAVALVGGLRPAAPAALGGGLALNYFFTEPLHTLAVDRPEQLVVLVTYLAVAVAVSAVVDRAARRTGEAARAQAEAEALSSVAGATFAEQETLPALLDRVRTVFGASQVSLVDGLGVPLATVGAATAGAGEVEHRLPAGPAELVVRGPALFGEDRRVLVAFAGAAATALEGRRLVAQAEQVAAVDRLRSALLTAVGHDLRTPLAGVKAAVSSLRAPDLALEPEDTAALLETIESSADRLGAVVSNLLDASRLEAGALSVQAADVGLDEVAARALAGLADRTRVQVDVPEELPLVRADPGLLERVLVNLLDNALRHDPGTVVLRGEPGRVQVVDHGPGLDALPAPLRSDRGDDRGLGLGLVVVQGFVDAMQGRLLPERTPGGGLTMTVELPRAAR